MIEIPVIKSIPIEILGFQFKIFTYVLMSAIGYIVALLFILHEVKRKKLSEKEAIIAFIVGYIGITVGSRLFFFFVPWWSYDRDWTLEFRILRFLNPFKPGMVFYGGLIGGVLAMWGYMAWRKLNMWKYFDAFAPGMLIGYAFGRIGCFITNDTCRGDIAANIPWAVVRTAEQGPIHPAP